MDFIQNLGSLRSPVGTYANLPITGNTLGDLRIVSDIGALYTWMLSSGSGSLSDWKKVTVSSFNDLKGKPDSSVLAINDAMQSYVRLCINVIWLSFIYIVNKYTYLYKMVGGMIDRFLNEDAIDTTRCINQLHQPITMPEGKYSSSDIATWYMPKKDGMDANTLFLLHGKGITRIGGEVGGFTFKDLLRQSLNAFNVSTDLVATKFGNGSMYFDGNYATYILCSGVDRNSILENKDFEYDFWFNSSKDGFNPFLISAGISIYKTVDNKIKAEITCLDGYEEDGSGIVTVLSAEGTSIISDGNWYHLAVQRRNGYIEIFVNGVKEATSLVTDNKQLQSNANLVLGQGQYQGENNTITGWYNGYLEEFRYSVDVVRYPSNFIPMTREYNSSSTEERMTIQSNGFEADATPTSARICIFEEDVDVINPNTDLKAYISRDAGTTFSEVTLERVSDMPEILFHSSSDVNWNIFTGAVDLSSQPNGKEVVYKIISLNNKDLRIRAVAINWK